ncbi:hypothetical protein B0H66DRAFT_516997 [Apodospora peruviana]|uniref:S-adenosyl-L-methionine-dependent tRNA 4-demethylwyosine synthase n=1 Tax=Apodospora peruviana TaxID=516989 RepID=A0AAE0M445_9PEZI|nr:hypothetical protein B0H66DRAFT_516997 [Apodospora peruviana]
MPRRQEVAHQRSAATNKAPGSSPSTTAGIPIAATTSHSTLAPSPIKKRQLRSRASGAGPADSSEAEMDTQDDDRRPLLDGQTVNTYSTPDAAMIKSSTWTTRNQWIVLALASGACAAFNGVFAKLTTTELTSTFSQGIARLLHLSGVENVIEVMIRCIFFGLNLVFNGVMWTLFTKALTLGNSTTQVSIINTSSNFVITAILGFAIFSESLPPLWWLGAAMLIAGNLIIGRKDEGSSQSGKGVDNSNAASPVETRVADDNVGTYHQVPGSEEPVFIPREEKDEDDDDDVLDLNLGDETRYRYKYGNRSFQLKLKYIARTRTYGRSASCKFSFRGLVHSCDQTVSLNLLGCVDEPYTDHISPSVTAIDVMELWHAHRIPIILSVLCILGLLILQSRSMLEQKAVEMLSRDLSTPAPEHEQNEQPAVKKATTLWDEKEEKPKKKPTSSVPRRIKGELNRKTTRGGADKTEEAPKIQALVFYSSLTANTERTAREFTQTFGRALREVREAEETQADCPFLAPHVLDLAEIDYDDYFISPAKALESLQENQVVTGPVELFYLFLVPSYNIDTINDTFLEHLQETHHDFRIDTAPLSSILGYSVFGFGDREGWPTEEEGFCFQAKEVDRWMAKLTGRKRAYPLGMGDWKRDGTTRLSEWEVGLTETLKLLEQTGCLGEGVAGSGDPLESDDEVDDDDDGEVVFDETSDSKTTKSKSSGDLEDVEDIGRIMALSRIDAPGGQQTKAPIAVDFTTVGKSKTRKAATTVAVKEMVPKGSPTYASLTKQGYSIVGSHSGVKICRWTKSALRGRGSCYKFSFYGINSHQCMETTPSLSCSNKCVFCWRHGTNPVGTTWRWVVDPPQLIFDGVKENHYKKIKMMRGVPGVRAERFAEAMRIRHCALSLVGEPIFYPHINEFLGMLHAERISSFLVCNAQHPDELAALQHVTQLYVSIDASNRESLRRIDRPLHRDFWERFQRCLEILRKRRFRQRTVFRLTLVKGFNVEDEAEGYADLVEKGLPCFVEVKGVTYCGTSTAGNAGLTMANVPFYQEVCDFVTALEKSLQKRGLKYGIAAEHAHSCCILLASERFKVDGKWHTLIDYDRFFQLLEAKGPDGDFSPEDYMGAATPEWATWGQGGFDPRDQRVDRKGRPIEVS